MGPRKLLICRSEAVLALVVRLVSADFPLQEICRLDGEQLPLAHQIPIPLVMEKRLHGDERRTLIPQTVVGRHPGVLGHPIRTQTAGRLQDSQLGALPHAPQIPMQVVV